MEDMSLYAHWSSGKPLLMIWFVSREQIFNDKIFPALLLIILLFNISNQIIIVNMFVV